MEDVALAELKAKVIHLLNTLESEQSITEPSQEQRLLTHLQRTETRDEVEAIVNKHIQAARDKVQTAVKAVHCDIEREMTTLTTELWSRIHEDALDSQELPACYFSQKVHRKSSSLMISMMKYPDFKTILNIFLAMMIVMFSGVVARDIVDQGIFVDLTLFEYALNKLPLALVFWPLQQLTACGVVLLVQITRRYSLSRGMWVSLYVFIQANLYSSSVYFTLVYAKLPIGTSIVTSIECARLSMKAHSYLREKMLYGFGPNEFSSFLPEEVKAKGITLAQTCPPTINILSPFKELQRFLYFCFAPTLIFRDSYPQLASKRRWGKIIFFGANWLGTVVFVYLIFRQLSITSLKNSWTDPWHPDIILASWLDSMLPATLLLLLIFFGFLHAWQNMWAELMLFSDRRFYGDWWNVSSFTDYYRKWNSVVYDWHHTYIYQDLVRFTRGRCSRQVSNFLTLVLADVLYEAQVALVLRCIYPLFSLIFGGPGVFFLNYSGGRRQPWNILIWVFMLVTTGFMICFYSWEYFSRQSLDLSDRYGLFSCLVPHSWRLFREKPSS
jgi:sterol O-acyltransferase